MGSGSTDGGGVAPPRRAFSMPHDATPALSSRPRSGPGSPRTGPPGVLESRELPTHAIPVAERREFPHFVPFLCHHLPQQARPRPPPRPPLQPPPPRPAPARTTSCRPTTASSSPTRSSWPGWRTGTVRKRKRGSSRAFYFLLSIHPHPPLSLFNTDSKHPRADPTFLQRRELCFTLDGDIFVRYLSFKVRECVKEREREPLLHPSIHPSIHPSLLPLLSFSSFSSGRPLPPPRHPGPRPRQD